jgi:hypothetical protein
LASVSIAINCACMSVASPGKGAVAISMPRKPSRPATDRPSAVVVMVTPAARSASSVAPRSATFAPTSSTSPPVMAAAQA